jgi:hypothetical protein
MTEHNTGSTATVAAPNAAAPPSAPQTAAPQNAAPSGAASFLQQYWLRLLIISAAVLTPCFWQRRIQAGDLGSHLYNAWLAQLIARGEVPGLYIARQWNNVLFDLLLLHLGNIAGLHAAEKIAVCAAVLIFFWGAFALICALSRQIPWRVLPAVAVFAYGWTFQMGFFNYYLSLGLAFAALALLIRGRGWQRALAALPVPLIWMAHPLGMALLAAVGAYLLIAETLPAQRQLYCAAAAAILLVGLRLYLAGHYTVLYSGSRYMFNGTDQLFLYNSRYRLLANALLLFVAACLLVDLLLRRRAAHSSSQPSNYALPLQLYALALLAAFLLPSIIFVPGLAGPVSMLTERLTSVSAVLACALVATTRPQKWHLLGFSALALAFFVFLYQSDATFNYMEDQAEQFERVLPPGQRVIATIWPLLGSRVLNDHFVDRACIGYCFAYGNYEAPSQQFRVRAQPGNPYVVSDYDVSDAMQSGIYIVQPQDLPLYQIYQCDLNRTKLCMRDLTAGEANGRFGFHMPANRPSRVP